MLFNLAYLLTKFFFQAEDGIRDVERSRGLGDVYKRQVSVGACAPEVSFCLNSLGHIYLVLSLIHI